MNQEFIYKSLLISNSPEVKTKFISFCEEMEITPIVGGAALDALEFLMDHVVDSIIIDTAIGEDEIISFLQHINNDVQNEFTPVIIVTEKNDYDGFADSVSKFNVISILSNTNWQVQAGKLLRCFRTKKVNVHSLTDNLIQSEGRSLTDPLTGAFNRYGAEDVFNNLTSRYKAYGEQFCVIMLDIDHFKNVNDTYGHDIGDEVLKDISKLILKSIRKDDALIRFGGEEFVIFISNIDINIAIRNSEKIREMIDATAHSSKYLDITASFGVVQYQNGEDMEDVLKRADKLLYKAKRSGRNKVMFLND